MKQFPLLCAIVALVGGVLGAAALPAQRIVGGDDAVAGQIAYQAAVFIAGIPQCGAVILSERYALTAMQCVCSPASDKPWPPQMFAIAIGNVDLYRGERIRVAAISIGSHYSDHRTGIALLRLAQPLQFDAHVRAIELSRADPPIGAIVEISGWGRLAETAEDMHRVLQLNEATALHVYECRRLLTPAWTAAMDSDVLCLGHARKNGICRGDFGGPAVYNGQLVGVAAHIVGECGSDLPDVFTSVATHYDWLQHQLSL